MQLKKWDQNDDNILEKAIRTNTWKSKNFLWLGMKVYFSVLLQYQERVTPLVYRAVLW